MEKLFVLLGAAGHVLPYALGAAAQPYLSGRRLTSVFPLDSAPNPAVFLVGWVLSQLGLGLVVLAIDLDDQLAGYGGALMMIMGVGLFIADLAILRGWREEDPRINDAGGDRQAVDRSLLAGLQRLVSVLVDLKAIALMAGAVIVIDNAKMTIQHELIALLAYVVASSMSVTGFLVLTSMNNGDVTGRRWSGRADTVAPHLRVVVSAILAGLLVGDGFALMS